MISKDYFEVSIIIVLHFPRELEERVGRTAGVLAGLGVKKGDVVAVYMPVCPAAVSVMLACARIGAVHSVVFAGFSAQALASRIQDGEITLGNIACCKYIRVRVRRVIPIRRGQRM